VFFPFRTSASVRERLYILISISPWPSYKIGEVAGVWVPRLGVGRGLAEQARVVGASSCEDYIVLPAGKTRLSLSLSPV
jgi:hypothetical protein